MRVANSAELIISKNMNKSDARKNADAHLAANPLSAPDYSWVATDPVDLGDGWYFNYTFQHDGGLPKDQWAAFGGAPGFLIDKATGAIRDVSWEEHGDRGL